MTHSPRLGKLDVLKTTMRDGRVANLTTEETLLVLLTASSMSCRGAEAPIRNALANLSRKGLATVAGLVWSATPAGRLRAARLNAAAVH